MIRLEAPPFEIVAPDTLRFSAERAARIAPGLASRLASLLGVEPLGRARIVLLEDLPLDHPLHSLAAGMPSWAAGQAISGSSTILLRPDRFGSYGQRELGSVLEHEITHLLVALSLPGRGSELPEWLSEGLASAMAGEGEWRDTYIVWTSPLARSASPYADLASAFRGGGADRPLAYAGSLAAVNFLISEHGSDFPKRLLAALRSGQDFPLAFREASGRSLHEAESAWREDLGRPKRWLFWISSTVTLWLLATLLFLVAWAIKRRRSGVTMERWREEEEPASSPLSAVEDDSETVH